MYIGILIRTSFTFSDNLLMAVNRKTESSFFDSSFDIG